MVNFVPSLPLMSFFKIPHLFGIHQTWEEGHLLLSPLLVFVKKEHHTRCLLARFLVHIIGTPKVTMRFLSSSLIRTYANFLTFEIWFSSSWFPCKNTVAITQQHMSRSNLKKKYSRHVHKVKTSSESNFFSMSKLYLFNWKCTWKCTQIFCWVGTRVNTVAVFFWNKET